MRFFINLAFYLTFFSLSWNLSNAFKCLRPISPLLGRSYSWTPWWVLFKIKGGSGFYYWDAIMEAAGAAEPIYFDDINGEKISPWMLTLRYFYQKTMPGATGTHKFTWATYQDKDQKGDITQQCPIFEQRRRDQGEKFRVGAGNGHERGRFLFDGDNPETFVWLDHSLPNEPNHSDKADFTSDQLGPNSVQQHFFCGTFSALDDTIKPFLYNLMFAEPYWVDCQIDERSFGKEFGDLALHDLKSVLSGEIFSQNNQQARHHVIHTVKHDAAPSTKFDLWARPGNKEYTGNELKTPEALAKLVANDLKVSLVTVTYDNDKNYEDDCGEYQLVEGQSVQYSPSQPIFSDSDHHGKILLSWNHLHSDARRMFCLSSLNNRVKQSKRSGYAYCQDAPNLHKWYMSKIKEICMPVCKNTLLEFIFKNIQEDKPNKVCMSWA